MSEPLSNPVGDRTNPAPRRTGEVVLRVDRVRCSAHGVCAQVLPGKVTLDEWGYPIVMVDGLRAAEARAAIRLCPAMALFRDGER